MEPRVAYGAVGLFVVFLSGALIALGLWMAGGLVQRDYGLYSIYFEESVSGLNIDAPVKYRGVVVGEVRAIELAPDNPERVHVIAAIEQKTPIKVNTLAKLDSQGITGILNVELTGGTRDAPPLISDDDPPYPVIESVPSLFARLDDALTEGLATLSRLSERVTSFLSPENAAALGETLENLALFTETLANNRDRVDRGLASAEQMFAAGAAVGEELPETVVELRAALAQFRQLAADLEETSVEVRGFAEAGQTGIEDVSRTTLPQVNSLIAQLQALTDSMTRLAEELREDPNMLIFGRSAPPPGPGER